jgi:Ca2+-binding EF-hand superfamily protein
MKTKLTVLSLIVAGITASQVSAEAPMRGPMSFENFDRNGDGIISRDEFNQARQQRIQQMRNYGGGGPAYRQRMNPEDMQGMPGRNMGRGPGMGRSMPAFQDIDRDGNGRVSEEELNTFRGERMRQRAEAGRMMRNAGQAPDFKSMDRDGDGSLSPREFAEHQQEEMQRRMEQRRRMMQERMDSRYNMMNQGPKDTE